MKVLGMEFPCVTWSRSRNIMTAPAPTESSLSFLILAAQDLAPQYLPPL
jgi:hypothetical protein